MSIATELTRLSTAKANIKSAIEGKGVTVPANTLLSGMASYITSITPKLQNKNATPSESAVTISPSSSYDGLSSVTVAAIPSTYIGSGITVQNFYTGSAVPSAGLGSNGDIYLQTT